MPKSVSAFPSEKSLVTLSRLLLSVPSAEFKADLSRITEEEFEELTALANSNHVVVRALDVFVAIMREMGDEMRAEWALRVLVLEQARIHGALPFLSEICFAFEEAGHDITVIKSLDHWPDIGSDLDLYTNAKPEAVLRLMKRRFDAVTSARSWGDRLACKWNFEISGLPESVEIHVGRLGQTGEQVSIAASVARRSRQLQIGNFNFRVPAVSDRLMISTLQRMYRHFYFRLCDIIDSANLADLGAIDYDDLKRSAEAAGIWEGVASYLMIVSDYVRQYRGTAIDLPEFVKAAADFGGEGVYYARNFLRVPIMPQSASLYSRQLSGMLRKKELHNSARLGLLPWLATAAVVGQKLTGSDKNIW